MGAIPKTRLETFSDGVIAIIITIMVLEMKAPHSADLWNNHHHLLHATQRINGQIMWANLHLLFWLSLVPFVTGWLGKNHGGSWPTALYGAVLLMAGFAYRILQRCIVASQGRNSLLATALGRDWKGTLSLGSYALALVLAFVNQWFADALYVLVAILWLVPDLRIERLAQAGVSSD